MTTSDISSDAAAVRVSPRQRTAGWYLPWLFLPPFLVVLAVNGILIHSAVTSFSGLTSQHASEEGGNYNQAIAAARAQAERGWQVQVAFAGSGGLNGAVSVEARDRDGKPLNGAEVTASFLRPTTAGFDQKFRLEDRGDGHYGAAVTVRLPGIWDLRLVIHHPAGDFQKIQRIKVTG